MMSYTYIRNKKINRTTYVSFKVVQSYTSVIYYIEISNFRHMAMERILATIEYEIKTIQIGPI